VQGGNTEHQETTKEIDMLHIDWSERRVDLEIERKKRRV
jgi:hypothetical protein